MFGDPIENPMGWNMKPLLSMGKCKNGMNFHYDEESVSINCLGVGDFKDNSIISDTGSLPVITLDEMLSDDYLLKDNNIVFVRSNGGKALVGRSVAVYPGGTPTTFSGFCIRYRVDDSAITVPYLLRVLKSESVRNKMAGRGANIQNLNQQILRTVTVPIPPMELQMEFSNFMEQTDKSKVVVQAALNEAQLLFDSLMQEYFG
jgi:type I restriction enzyme S subunit